MLSNSKVMLYLFDLLWEKICGVREKIIEKKEKYAYVDKVMDYNTILCDGNDISDYGQYVEIDNEYFYDNCTQKGCKWCASRYEMEEC